MENKSVITISKMISYAEETISFARDFSFQNFSNNRMIIAACVFNLSQIGELVKVIDTNIKNKYQNIKWVAVENLRHRIVHDYEGIQIDLIWQIIKEDLPSFIDDLKKILLDGK